MTPVNRSSGVPTVKRPWVVRPAPGEMEVSDEAMIESLMEAAALLKRAGGVLTVIVQRVPTDFPGERVTTAAVFEWKDRTDARPQPESFQQFVSVDPDPEELEAHLEREAVEEARSAGLGPDPDAEALERLPEEDNDAIPLEAR